MSCALKFGVVLWVAVVALARLAPSRPEFPDDPISFGSCPRFPVFPSFSLDKFLGVWHLDHQYEKRFLPCQIFNFTKTSNFTMNISGSVRHGFSSTLSNDARSISNHQEPGLMKWSWNYLPTLMDKVTVIDTDYNSYAVLILCSDYGLFHTNFVFGITRNIPMNKFSYDVSTANTNKTEELTSPLVKNLHYPRRNYCAKREREMKNIDIDQTVTDIGNFFLAISKI